jgi:hypothetical protein
VVKSADQNLEFWKEILSSQISATFLIKKAETIEESSRNITDLWAKMSLYKIPLGIRYYKLYGIYRKVL